MARKAVRIAKKETETGVLYQDETNNVVIELCEDGMARITFDPNARLGESKSGKSTLIATTCGNKSLMLNGKIYGKIGLNIYI